MIVDIVLLVLRLTLASVFVLAGAAKLADRERTLNALSEFGVGLRIAKPGARVLPLTELIIAVTLIPSATAWFGAIGALALLLIFSTAIVINLRHGRRPDCRCFGQLHSTPIGRTTLARNTGLTSLAVLIVTLDRYEPKIDPTSWIHPNTTPQSLGVAVTLVLAGAIGVFVWSGQRSTEDIEKRADSEPHDDSNNVATSGERIEPGRTLTGKVPGLPPFRLPGIDGRYTTLDDLRRTGKPVLLIFSDPECGTCSALMPEIGQWQREYASKLTLVIISTGGTAANRAKSAEYRLGNVLVQEDWEVGDAYGAETTPSAILVDTNGSMGSGIVAGTEGIRRLLAQTVNSYVSTAGQLPDSRVFTERSSRGRHLIPGHISD
jgi:uncharacterized membrane protein YphA (DoxX/SURF4 family)/thiol-disulfide isomerase/thioredoxin